MENGNMFVLMPKNEKQKAEIFEFLEAFNIPNQDGELYFKRRRFQEKRKELEKELSRVMKKYANIFRKEVRKTPAYIDLLIEPNRFVMMVFDEKGNRMELKEHGELQCLKAVWLAKLKEFVSYARSKGINSERTSFIFKEIDNVNKKCTNF